MTDRPNDDETLGQLPKKDATDARPTEEPRSHAGRPDQDVKHTTGAGAGGATEWGGGNANHPSRINSKPPGH